MGYGKVAFVADTLGVKVFFLSCHKHTIFLFALITLFQFLCCAIPSYIIPVWQPLGFLTSNKQLSTHPFILGRAALIGCCTGRRVSMRQPWTRQADLIGCCSYATLTMYQLWVQLALALPLCKQKMSKQLTKQDWTWTSSSYAMWTYIFVWVIYKYLPVTWKYFCLTRVEQPPRHYETLNRLFQADRGRGFYAGWWP